MARDPAKALNRWFEALRRLFRPAADTGQEVQEAPAQVPLSAVQMTALFPALGAFLAGQKRRAGGWIRQTAQPLPTWAGGRDSAPGPARRRTDWRGSGSIQAQRRASPARLRFAGAAQQFARHQQARYQATAADEFPSTMPPPSAPFQPAGPWAPGAETIPGPSRPTPASQPGSRALPTAAAQPPQAPGPIEVVTPLPAQESIPAPQKATGQAPSTPPSPRAGPKALLQHLAAIWRPSRTLSAGQLPTAGSLARPEARPARMPPEVPLRVSPVEAATTWAEMPPPTTTRPSRSAQSPAASDAPVRPDERTRPPTAPLDSTPKEDIPLLSGRRSSTPGTADETALPAGEGRAVDQWEAVPSTAARIPPTPGSVPRGSFLDLWRRPRRPQPAWPAAPGAQTAPGAAELGRLGQAPPKQPAGMAPPPVPISPTSAPEKIRPEPAPPPQPAVLPLYSEGTAAPGQASTGTAPGQSELAGPVLSQVGPAARALSRRVQQGLRRLGPGKPLPQTSRAFLERVLGRRLDMLRLHDEAEAAAVTGEIGAAAATVGPHIIVTPTRSGLSGPRGLALLAHEAVHAIQNIERGPTAEGAPRARGQELEALQAEAAVRRTTAPPLRPAKNAAPSMPLWQGRFSTASQAPGGGFPGTEGAMPPAAAGPPPQAVRAVPTAGPLQRTGAATTPAQQAPGPAEAGEQRPGPPDLDQLAEEVYRRILYRLNLEREWRGF